MTFACLAAVATTAEAEQVRLTRENLLASRYDWARERMTSCPITVRYDPQIHRTYFYWADGSSAVAIELEEDQIGFLREYFEKYLEWNKKAIDEQTKMQLEIGKYTFTGWFQADGELWKQTHHGLGTGILTFFSQTPNSHQAVLQFGQFESRDDNTSYEPESVYLSERCVRDLLSATSFDNMVSAMKRSAQ
ncbi:MAG: hypothetical protein QF689_13975 [Candidatus Latescibacteria bacterium]|jgi:hypothetical protein|nr:hypothetical protein [Candidatus Latescibacterota bacterium]HJP29174.1 hypothetical protein [Candidatus Latescibacterota bacterium]